MENNNRQMDVAAHFIDAIRRGGVHFGVEASTQSEAIEAAVATVRLPGNVDRTRVLDQVFERERKVTTGIGGGFAMPHTKYVVPMIEPVVGLLYLRQAVDWHSLDGRRVERVAVLVSSSPTVHVYLCSGISSVIRSSGLLDEIATLRKEDEALALIAERLLSPMRQVSPSKYKAGETGEAIIRIGTSGLHSGPAAALLQAISGLNVRITLRGDENSILLGGQSVPIAGGQMIELDGAAPDPFALMQFPLDPGTRLKLSCAGPDAGRALAAVRQAITDPARFEGASFTLAQ